MSRIVRRLLLCAAVASLSHASFAAEPEATKAVTKKLDLKFVPNDAVAAAVVHPKRIITSPQFELWPTEIFSAGGKKEFGFDPMQIELAVGVVAMPQMAGAQQPQPGAAQAGPAQPALWRCTTIHAAPRCQTCPVADCERWPRRSR